MRERHARPAPGGFRETVEWRRNGTVAHSLVRLSQRTQWKGLIYVSKAKLILCLNLDTWFRRLLVVVRK